MAKYRVKDGGYSVVLNSQLHYVSGQECELTDEQYQSHHWKLEPVKAERVEPSPVVDVKAIKETDVVNRAMSTESAKPIVGKKK